MALCQHEPVSDDIPSSMAEGPDAGYTLRLGEGKTLPKWVWRLILAVAFSVAAFQVSMSILGKLAGLLGILAVSLFLSFAIEPGVNYLSDRGWKRGVATFFSFVVLAVLVGLFVFVMAELVISQVSELVEKAPDYVDQIADWANSTFDTDINTNQVTDQLQEYQSDIAGVAADVGGKVVSITGSLLSTVFKGFTVLLFSYYMTSQGPLLRRNICSVLPEQRQRTFMLLWELAIQKTGGWIYSRLLLATLSAACTWVFLAILGVPSPLALALWVGLVSQFIPAIGTYLAGALPVLIALLNDPIDALWVLGFILIYQQVENYFFSPKITARTMELHPAVAFGAAIAGAALAGPIGAIVALPAAGVVQAFVSTFLDRHEVIKSHLTEWEEMQDTEGDSAVRQSMNRLLRSGKVTSDDPVQDEGPDGP